jgi:hypothetical protein
LVAELLDASGLPVHGTLELPGRDAQYTAVFELTDAVGGGHVIINGPLAAEAGGDDLGLMGVKTGGIGVGENLPHPGMELVRRVGEIIVCFTPGFALGIMPT